jgi:hypothetical protein
MELGIIAGTWKIFEDELIGSSLIASFSIDFALGIPD